MDPIKEKSPAALGGATGRGIEIKRRALLSINMITEPALKVKPQRGGRYEDL